MFWMDMMFWSFGQYWCIHQVWKSSVFLWRYEIGLQKQPNYYRDKWFSQLLDAYMFCLRTIMPSVSKLWFHECVRTQLYRSRIIPYWIQQLPATMEWSGPEMAYSGIVKVLERYIPDRTVTEMFIQKITKIQIKILLYVYLNQWFTLQFPFLPLFVFSCIQLLCFLWFLLIF